MADNSAAPSRKKVQRVAAPMVTGRTETGRVVYLYRGDVVGSDLTKESVEHLDSLGFLTSEDVPQA